MNHSQSYRPKNIVIYREDIYAEFWNHLLLIDHKIEQWAEDKKTHRGRPLDVDEFMTKHLNDRICQKYTDWYIEAKITHGEESHAFQEETLRYMQVVINETYNLDTKFRMHFNIQ